MAYNGGMCILRKRKKEFLVGCLSQGRFLLEVEIDALLKLQFLDFFRNIKVIYVYRRRFRK